MAIAWDASATTITSVINAVCTVIVCEGFRRLSGGACRHRSYIRLMVLISLSQSSHSRHLTNHPIQSVWQSPRHRSAVTIHESWRWRRRRNDTMIVISIILADRRVSISLTVISKVDKLVPLSGLTRISLLLAGPRTWSVWTSDRPAWWHWTPPWSRGRCPGPRSARRPSSRWMSLRRKSVDGDDKMIREGFKEKLVFDSP